VRWHESWIKLKDHERRPHPFGQIVVRPEQFELFEGLAGEMGSREWQRVIRLADRAVKKRKKVLACQVFEAALTEGSHRDFLAK
jgi:hypothetical protein